jgi:hypothetical protein
VSLLNVVATIDRPANHQGTDRPETKNSDVFLPALLPKNRAGKKQMTRVKATISQSMRARCTFGSFRLHHEGMVRRVDMAFRIA